MPTVGERPRRTVRFPFVAQAQVIPEDGTTVRTQVTELSLHGCYLEFGGLLSTGTRVTVKIFEGQDFFEASASVVYCQPSVGLGLVFRDVKPHYLSVLQTWLLRSMKGPDPQAKDS
jgi:PilZ domain